MRDVVENFNETERQNLLSAGNDLLRASKSRGRGLRTAVSWKHGASASPGGWRRQHLGPELARGAAPSESLLGTGSSETCD